MIKGKLKNCFAESYRLIWMFVLSLVFANAASLTLSAQDGYTLWDDNCSDCHSIGDGVYLGPDLQGINAKRPASWMLSFIKSSKTMIANGDPDAVALFEEFKKKKMPDFALSDAEIQAILAYIASQSPQATNEIDTSKPAPDDQNLNIESGNTEQNDNGSTQTTNESQNSGNTQNNVSNANSGGGVSSERLDQLEEKLNQVIAFQRNLRPTEITSSDIKKGEHLFKGKTAFEYGAASCISCHNIIPTDTFNWNPSASEIIAKFKFGSGNNIEDELSNPQTEKMKKLLLDHPLTNSEIFYLSAYIHDVSKKDLWAESPRDNKSKLAWIILVLILLSLIDLMITKVVKPRAIPTLIFLLGIVFESYVVFGAATSVGLSQGYSPDQPIKFSHKVHAGENQINCKYCHSTVEYSQTAGIPSANVCMNCHNKIKSGTHTGTYELDKLRAAVKDKKPIEWVKVHNLPDHVYYNHAQHVNVGKLDCIECHGDVAKMDRIKQVNTLSMGWCLNCHRNHEVNFDNKFYDSYKILHDKISSGDIDTVLVKDIGGEDCQSCHY